MDYYYYYVFADWIFRIKSGLDFPDYIQAKEMEAFEFVDGINQQILVY